MRLVACLLLALYAGFPLLELEANTKSVSSQAAMELSPP